MKRKIFVFIAIFILGITAVSCAKVNNAEENTSKITEGDTESAQNTEIHITHVHEPESETVRETEVKYELNTVEALEDDGKEMSSAEAIRSVMKGKHSALELMFDERFFSLTKNTGWQQADEIKDMSDTGLARINMLTYNRAMDKGITPMDKAVWRSFVCVDLDQNGTDEILVKGGPGGVVLHYAGGEVYITVINVRAFPCDVYENGVYNEGDGGAFALGYDRLYPAKGAMYTEKMAYKYDDEGLTINKPKYQIKGKDVAKEEYDAYVEGLIGGLTPLEWHEFTEENIDRYVVD